MSKFVCKNGVLYLSNTDFADGGWCVTELTLDIVVTQRLMMFNYLYYGNIQDPFKRN